ncbi:hypothetical protein Q3O60_08590 [Alkalimonas collagenimarina]|uniref:Ankyrin repeat domain-containing protein n=1 Tax=Alkalimonas collagenimarina TaxID=400390 RepID=A0ABT9GZ63_9GAMM|nr:hypothetical protein [Alkalimonas collagenimarina]MDP4536243.1 hypothetical protein [Alkalimonas collagenimarina]
MFNHFISDKKTSFVVLLCIAAFPLLFHMKSWGGDGTGVSDDGMTDQINTLSHLVQQGEVHDLQSFLQAEKGAYWLQDEAAGVATLKALESRCSADIVIILIKYDVGLSSSQAGTPFHNLAFNDSVDESIECMDALVHAGVDINAVDKEGHTALVRTLYSHQENTLQIIEELLARGADPTIRSERGLDLIHHALMLRLLYTEQIAYSEQEDVFSIKAQQMIKMTEQVNHLASQYYLSR